MRPDVVSLGESSPAAPGKSLVVILSLGSELIKVLIKLGPLKTSFFQSHCNTTEEMTLVGLPYTMYDLI